MAESERLTAVPSAGRIAWIRRVVPQWTARAIAVRAEGDRGALIRAAVLEDICRRYQDELSAFAAPSDANELEASRLEAIVNRSAGPYRHPEWGIMINDAPFLDDVRHTLRCRIARLRGQPDPAYQYMRTTPPGDGAPPPVAPPPPPPEAAPFRAGPQLTLFEFTA